MSHLVEIAAYEPDLAPNLGSLVRLGVCFAAPVHVIEPCGFPFSLKLLRTRALDYVDKADIRHHDSWPDFQASRRGRVILLTTKSGTDLWDFRFEKGDCLLFGRESAGVPDDVHDSVDERVTIEMPGGGRSLNVAIAAGIALSEAIRQLR
ncbi:MAG: tRNA (cytidine(34)-2'-O)-methyltransferase [Litoreibacter sp.]|nr:tRNA (cytidine(34)-2'-O)-methyltransferase [Litoreibacter sp.]